MSQETTPQSNQETMTNENTPKNVAIKPISTRAQRRRENSEAELKGISDFSKPKMGERKNIIFKRTITQYDQNFGTQTEIVHYPQMSVYRAVVWLERKNKSNLIEKITIAYNPKRCIDGPSDEDLKLRSQLEKVEYLLNERAEKVESLKSRK